MNKGAFVMILGLIGVVIVRQYQWRAWQQDLIKRGSLNISTVIVRPVEVGEYGCLFGYRGLRLNVAKKLCIESGLKQALPGDWVKIEGRVDQRMSQVKAESRELNRWSIYLGLRLLGQVQQKMAAVIYQSLAEPAASLVSGMVLGQKTTMSPAMKSVLETTGTTHVVVASGYNLSLVAGLVMAGLVKCCSRRKAAIVTIGMIWLYAIITGANPPVIRAATMLSMVLVAVGLGREAWTWWVFGLSTLVIVGVWPWMAVNLSFQLSVAATVGVMASGSLLTHKPIKNQIGQFGLETGLTTIGATLMTAPLILMAFGKISWLGLVVNPLVLWLVPVITTLGMLVIGLGSVWLPLGIAIGWLLAPIGQLWWMIVTLAATLPVEMIELRVNGWMAWGWWLGLVAVWSGLVRKRRKCGE